jgi:hypothetical protein
VGQYVHRAKSAAISRNRQGIYGIPNEQFWDMMQDMGEQVEAYEQERHERADQQRAVGGGRDYEHPLVVQWQWY